MRNIAYAAAVAFSVLWLNAGAAFAVTMDTAVPAARADRAPPLDPSLSDPAWAPGKLPAGDFINLSRRSPAPFATTVWMLYDDRNIYVGFRCEQRGVPIVADQTTNDVGFGLDDFVGVGLDTSGTGTQTYYFETTPRGVRYEQANENARYHPAWQSAAKIDGTSWSAVLIVPLNIVRIHPGSPQTWRINFVRNVAALAEHYTWAYNGVMSDGPIGNGWPNFTDTRFWAAWSGVQVTRAMLRASRPKPRLELYGLSSSGGDRNIFQQANGTFGPENVRFAGADLSYPITPTINFVGTANPDFSNVEIDQQTIAPQEFRRQLLEYRPFFAQGAAYINANSAALNQNLTFYSPGVGPFDYGLKTEGVFGKQSFGILNFRGYNETTNDTFDDTAYGYKHALQNRTFLYWADGVWAHHSIAGNDATNEFGLAGRNLKTGFVWGFDQSFEQGSWLQHFYPGTGQSQQGFVDVHKQNYEVNFGYMHLTPFYNPLDGFTANSDINGPIGYAWSSGATPFVKNYTFNINGDRFPDQSGAVHQADFGLTLNATLRNGFSINGLGPAISELRSYSLVNPAATGTKCSDPALPRTYFAGYPNYDCGRDDTFNLMAIPFGYGDGTPRPIDASVSFGRFGYGLIGPGDNGSDYLHLYTISTSRPVARIFSLGLEYDGTVERGIESGLLNSQWLRRISIGADLGPNENFTVSLRGINGTGGFAQPGNNLAAAYHHIFRSGNELFVNYGTPAAPYTLNRLIFKYIFRMGGGAGT